MVDQLTAVEGQRACSFYFISDESCIRLSIRILGVSCAYILWLVDMAVMVHGLMHKKEKGIISESDVVCGIGVGFGMQMK